MGISQHIFRFYKYGWELQFHTVPGFEGSPQRSSSAPYFHPAEFPVNAPSLLGCTTEMVARIRGGEYEDVLMQTTANVLPTLAL